MGRIQRLPGVEYTVLVPNPSYPIHIYGPVIAGGHSYGGRQTSMVVAENPALVDMLTLFSYPLHPPGKPERLRTEHFGSITSPTVFTHGTADPFGRILAKISEGAGAIPEPVSRTSTWQRGPRRATRMSIRPPSSLGSMPCRTAFSTSVSSVIGGQYSARASSSTWIV